MTHFPRTRDMQPVRLHFSEDLVRRAVRAFWWRAIGPAYVVGVALLAGPLAFALRRGDRSWWVGVVGTVLALAVWMAFVLYVVHYRASLNRLRRMKTPEGVMELGDERVRFSSDAGVTELEWSGFTELWRFPDFWLLFLSRAQWMTLPAADLSDEARAHILARVKHSAKDSR